MVPPSIVILNQDGDRDRVRGSAVAALPGRALLAERGAGQAISTTANDTATAPATTHRQASTSTAYNIQMLTQPYEFIDVTVISNTATR